MNGGNPALNSNTKSFQVATGLAPRRARYGANTAFKLLADGP